MEIRDFFAVLSFVRQSRCSEHWFRSNSEGLCLNVCKLASLADRDPCRIMLWSLPDVVTFSGWFSDINSA